MSRLFITGYSDRPSVAPGEPIDFYVGTERPTSYEARVVRLGYSSRPDGDEEVLRATDGEHFDRILFEPVEADVDGTYHGNPQRTQVGGYVEVPDPTGVLAGHQGLTVHVFVSATTPMKRQGIVSRLRRDTGEGWALTLEDGYPTFTVAAHGGRQATVRSTRRLFADVFYSIVAGFDPHSGELFVEQRLKRNRTNSRLGLVVPLDSDADGSAPATVVVDDAAVPVILAGVTEEIVDDRTWVTDAFNGKLDAPKVFDGALERRERDLLHAGGAPSTEARASWDFSAQIHDGIVATDVVTDGSGSGLDGLCVNQPDRAMTGWNWDGTEENFRHCPEQYGAIWFHSDSLDDSCWEDPITYTPPDDLASGAYALQVTCEEGEDQIPFFVTPPRGTATAKIAVLVPTLSYLAYANSQDMQSAPNCQAIMGLFASIETRDLELNENPGPYGLSTYDYHEDGRGVQYSSWRRPLLSMRPRYRHEYGSLWQFPADMQLLGWLDGAGFEYDVITDHDLHAEGKALLDRYNVVLTGTHPEYYSAPMMDAWEDYLATGGRGMYLAGNGFIWVTSVHPDKPWMLECRKGETGTQAWRARPGEYYHEFSAERGGIWRMRGRPPQKTWGIGMSSHGLDVSTGYVQLPDARDPRIGWILEGVDADETIGDFGLVNGGAAGLEMDIYDLELGTPPHAMLLAGSYGHSVNAVLVPEEQFFPHAGMNGIEHPRVRADIVYFTTPEGGAVFSTGSMTWSGSLPHDEGDNNVARITANVLRAFMSDEPVPELV